MPDPAVTTRDRELADSFVHQHALNTPAVMGRMIHALSLLLAQARQEGREEAHQGVLALIGEVRAWQAETFPAASPEGVSKHLLEEAGELVEDPRSPEELADCMMLVVCCADLAGVDLVGAVRAKLEVVKAREWEFDAERGYHKTKSEDQPAPPGAKE